MQEQKSWVRQWCAAGWSLCTNVEITGYRQGSLPMRQRRINKKKTFENNVWPAIQVRVGCCFAKNENMHYKQNIVLWIKVMLTFLGTDDHKLKKCLRTDDHKFKTANVHNTRSIITHFTSTCMKQQHSRQMKCPAIFRLQFFFLSIFCLKVLAFML